MPDPNPDLEFRLRSVDALDPPDLWESIQDRPAQPSPRDPMGRRILVAVLALTVSAAAIGLASWAFRGTSAPARNPIECFDTLRRVPHPYADNQNGAFGFDALQGITATGPDDAWTVGSSGFVSHGPVAIVPTATIQHWDGERWTAQTPAFIRTSTNSTRGAVPQKGPLGDLMSIAGTSPDDVWTVGYAGLEP